MIGFRKGCGRTWLAVILTVTLALGLPSDSLAKAKKRIKNHNSKYAALVINANTREIMYQDHAKSRRFPASLTKMMTLYLTFDALSKQEIKLSTTMTASRYAAQQPKTNLNMSPGNRITVDQAIRALVVHSANDVSVILAEHLGGSVQRFATMMTQKAHALGMQDTQFRNPNGLPDDAQYTTAYDMAILALALKKHFPQYYPYFKIEHFTYKGKPFKGHNRVMGRFEGADGIKTGYIRASGFNLVTSAERGGQRVIGVLMGEPTSRIRDDHMVQMMTNAFIQLDRRVAKKNSAPKPKTTPKATPTPKSQRRK